MKKFNLRFTSIILVLIFALTVFCSCAAKSYDGAAPESMNGAKDNLAGSTVMSPESSNSQASLETERKIIKTVNISAETKEFDKTVENINKMIADIGGYIENSSVNGNSLNYSGSRSRNASFTLRVPADKLDEFTGTVENSVNVTNITSNSKEITEAYYDAKSRLAVLEAQRDSLQKMYDSFDKPSDMSNMLAVQDKLYDVIQEIESYQARINSYDNKVSFSTVQITLSEVLEYTPVDSPKNFGERFVTSFKRGWVDFWSGCQNFAVWFAGAIPSLIIIAGIAVAAVFVIRAVVKKAKAKKAQRKTEKDNNSKEENKTE